MEKVYCSKCGKCMTSKDGTAIIGIVISASIQNDADKASVAFMEKQFGRHMLKLDRLDKNKYRYNKGFEFNFCYECVIDSYMGR